MKQLTKNQIIKFMKDHYDFIKKEFGVAKIALFGSYARNEAHEKSDIDILIECKKVSFRNRMALKRFLEKHFHKTVDVIYFNSLRTIIRQTIEKDLIYV